MSEKASKSHQNVDLPVEVILRILEISAWSYSTPHARSICLVSQAAYKHCWPSLYRIIALRNAEQLKGFSEYIYRPALYDQDDEIGEIQKLKRKQDAIQYLYLNNNKDAARLKEISDGERPDMWMMSILLAAKRWEAPEEKPLLAYPLMLFSSFPTAFQTAFAASPKSPWAQRLLSHRTSPDTAFLEDILSFQLVEKDVSRKIAQPQELTLSALAMSTSHLMPSSLSAPAPGKLPHNVYAFENVTRLHLYFAKMDPLLVQTLLGLPSLTHLRLTRSFSENLSEAVLRLLGLDDERDATSMRCLIVEAGVYMDQRTMTAMRHMQGRLGKRKRLFLMDNMMPQKDTREESLFNLEASASSPSNSTSHVVHWVTSSEERGFAQFKQRASSEEGVWMVH